MTNYQELISVVISVYNIEDYIPRCLECLSSQTYKNLEIILVDDGSDDKSGVILDEFASKDPRARVFHHERNLGPSAARNTGLDAATGAYIWFPDGDDYFHRDFVRVLYEAIKKDDGYDIALVGWKATSCTTEETESRIIPQYTTLSQDTYFSYVFKKNPDVWNKLFKMTAIDGLRFKPYPRAQVRDFILRAAFSMKSAILVENCMYYWMQRPGSLSKTPDAKELYFSCKCSMYYDMYSSLPDSQNHFKDILLCHMIYIMIQWKLLVDNGSNKDEVFNQCKVYERAIRWPYILNKGINRVERVVCMVLVHNPRLVSRLHSYKVLGPQIGLGSIRYKVASFLLRYAFL